MATLEDTKHKAGRLLGITAYGRALRADDDLLLAESYRQVYDSLDREGIAIWPENGAIPDRCMPHVAALMAFNVATDKAVSAETYSQVLALQNIAKAGIRRETTPKYESYTRAKDY